MEQCGVPFEVLTGRQVMSKWPQFQIEEDMLCIYQPEGGIAPAAKCMAAHIRLALTVFPPETSHLLWLTITTSDASLSVLLLHVTIRMGQPFVKSRPSLPLENKKEV